MGRGLAQIQEESVTSQLSIVQQVTFLYTRDLEATDCFYREMLGLQLVLDQGDCRIYSVAGGAYLGFCRRDSAPDPAAGESVPVILTLVTAQVDEWYRCLCERGVAFARPPTLNAKYNIYHCFLRDPNGYLIEIQCFLDPGWPDASLMSTS
jgi:catechol 2,3-dioxygenase-like lactoylglutathione lyase family enzyme